MERAAGILSRRLFVELGVCVALVWAPYSHAATINNLPTTSTTGTFTPTWPSGYYLQLTDVNWRFAGPPTTSYPFTGLASGTYNFSLASCSTTFDPELGWITTCTVDPASLKTVTVTRDAEPTLDLSTTEAGTSPYVATTTNRGSSRVTIPIRAIPGVNGLGPQLALEYDSARGSDLAELYTIDDFLGYGWSVGGIPQLHRCHAGDTFPWGGGTPNVDNNDRLCLDGVPLQVVSGTYWMTNAEYRTEAQSYVKITQIDSGTSFQVRYPDGRVATFGGSNDSIVLGSGALNPISGDISPNGILSWGLRLMTNGLGNSLSISYEKFDGYGELHPKTISYAGAAIEFKYGPRTDLAPKPLGSPGFSGGQVLIRRQPVLNKINVVLNGAMVREYRIDSNLVNGRLRVENVQECGYTDGNFGRLPAADCLRLELRVRWGDQPPDRGLYRDRRAWKADTVLLRRDHPVLQSDSLQRGALRIDDASS